MKTIPIHSEQPKGCDGNCNQGRNACDCEGYEPVRPTITAILAFGLVAACWVFFVALEALMHLFTRGGA